MLRIRVNRHMNEHTHTHTRYLQQGGFGGIHPGVTLHLWSGEGNKIKKQVNQPADRYNRGREVIGQSVC